MILLLNLNRTLTSYISDMSNEYWVNIINLFNMIQYELFIPKRTHLNLWLRVSMPHDIPQFKSAIVIRFHFVQFSVQHQRFKCYTNSCVHYYGTTELRWIATNFIVFIKVTANTAWYGWVSVVIVGVSFSVVFFAVHKPNLLIILSFSVVRLLHNTNQDFGSYLYYDLIVYFRCVSFEYWFVSWWISFSNRNWLCEFLNWE